MKKLTTVSLIIFGVSLVVIFITGFFFFHDKNSNQVKNSQGNNFAQSQSLSKTTNMDVTTNSSKGKSNSSTPATNKSTTTPASSRITLNMAEIAKHNSQNDCWMLISGKVYNITSYFGKHPGGNATMDATCGKDATAAYMTKDPNATESGFGSAHSSRAKSLLDNYYLGDFGQTI